MRLVCPNCDAMYEVPDSVIPAEGRDVQCSNCGKTWYFSPVTPDVMDVDEPAGLAPEPQPEPTPEPAPRPEPPRRASPTPPPPRAPQEAHPAEEAPVADAPAVSPAPATPRRRPLDASVTDILREEAAFEARAREEDSSLEYQDDLPLEEPEPQTTSYIDAEPEPSAGGASSRRDLLPDIDEINSTLRATSERASPEAVSAEVASAMTRRRQGFRTGFGLALIVLATLTFGYTTADTLIDSVPAAAPLLDSYVATVNAGRGWLEDAVEGLVQRMGA